MGTHVSSPSRVATSGDLLSDYLKQNQDDIGAQIVNRFSVSDGVLPFLFKVLSIEKALSIQVHPDKATAEKLHAEQPHIYKGAHKQVVLILLVHTGYRWKSQAGDGNRSDAIFSSLRIPSYRPHCIVFGGCSGVCGLDSTQGPANVHRFCLLPCCLLPGNEECTERVVHIVHDCRENSNYSGVEDLGRTIQRGRSERNGKSINGLGDTVERPIPRRYRHLLPVCVELRGAREG
jgi:hypothetical protein